MIYWIRVHKDRHGDIEQQFETFKGLMEYLLFCLHDGWTVTCLKVLNRGHGDGMEV